jgi:D-amino-acid dehydrogenase
MSEVVVIGGGLVGASATYRLARSKVKVTLVDRADQGQATAAGAGIISPGTNFKPPAPFFPLAFQAVEHYPELLSHLAEDGETDTGYGVVGLLFVAMSEDEATRLPDMHKLIIERRTMGVKNIGEVTLLDGKSAKELFPALAEIPAAIHTSGAARMDGRLMRDALTRAAQKRGATVVKGSAELVVKGDRVTGVMVNGSLLPADQVIIAGGAWSSALGERLGINLPVFPQRGQILHLEMPNVNTSQWPIVLGFHSHYMLTFPNNRVVAGATREDDSGFDYRLTAGGVHEALSEALRVAPGLGRGTLKEVRIGLRPGSPDQLPILGRAPGLANLYLATGHGASGLQLGPYSAAAVADLLLGKALQIDLSPYSPDRFHLLRA